MLLITFVVAIVFAHLHGLHSLKVCSSFWDYMIPFSGNCYDNPDGESNTTEIIRGWGFTSEEIYITTKDGYKVLINSASGVVTKPNPIFFVHGFGMNSRGFVQLGNKSLPYILTKMGYLVYIMNLRGTLYSRQHVNLTTNDQQYWKYSFHQMAIYDVRNAIELITEKSNEKVIYIGYSMGTTISYIYSSLHPQEAKERLLGIISLAPVVYLNNNTRSILKTLARLWSPIKPFVYLFNHGEVALKLFNDICPTNPATMFVCTLVLEPIFGDDFEQQWDALSTRIILKLGIDTMGAEVITHFAQWIKSGKFEHYNHGETKNLIKYNQTTPPLYNLEKILVPTSLIVGRNDWLASDKNAEEIYSKINTKCGYIVVPWDKWCHTDFTNAKNLDIILAPLVVDKIREFETGVCAKYIRKL